MARSGAAQIVNNFVGGLVTEANGLTFPPNSLSKAMNVEIGVDGSIRTRQPFTRTSYSVYSPSYLGDVNLLAKKIFHWEELGATVLYTLTEDSFEIVVLNNEGLVSSPAIFTFAYEEERVRDQLKDFDMTFNKVDAYFILPQIWEDTERVAPMLRKIHYNRETGEFELLESYSENIVKPSSRDPESGDYWDGRSGTTPTNRGVIQLTTGAKPKKVQYYWWWPSEGINGTKTTANTLVRGGVTYYLGTQKDSSGAYKYFGIYKRSGTVDRSFKLSGAQPIYYRDFKGVPNTLSDPDLEIPYEKRNDDSTMNTLWNLSNAGWKFSNSTEFSADRKGSSVLFTSSSLCSSTREKTGSYPSSCDASYEWLSESADTPEVVGVYNPYQLQAGEPTRTVPLQGSEILALGKEFMGNLLTYKTAGSYYFPIHLRDSGDSSSYKQSKFEEDLLNLSKSAKVYSLSYINGRMWYGVDSEVANIFYSQIKGSGSSTYSTKDLGELVCCYQRNDPTSDIGSELLDSDGGFLNIEGCGKILKILSLSNHLVVFGDNGIWAISGELGNSFTPTNYSIIKISNQGAASREGILEVDGSVFFLSRDSLKIITPSLEIQDISSGKVLKKLRNISKKFLDTSIGTGMLYDNLEKRIIIYYPHSGTSAKDFLMGIGIGATVYDLRMECYYEWRTSSLAPVYLPAFDIWAGYNQDGEGFIYPEVSDGIDFLTAIGFIKGKDDKIGLLQRSVTLEQNSGQDPLFRLFKYFAIQEQEATLSREDLTELTNLRYATEFEIPFNNFDNIMSNKIVSEIGVLLDSSEDYSFVLNDTDVVAPQLEMRWSWDWARESQGSTTFSTTTRYPVIPNIDNRDVEITKYRIPGSGRSLTLNFKDVSDGDSTGSKLLGYWLSLSQGV